MSRLFAKPPIPAGFIKPKKNIPYPHGFATRRRDACAFHRFFKRRAPLKIQALHPLFRLA